LPAQHTLAGKDCYHVRLFHKGGIDGEGDAACGKGVVERGREEFAGACEGQAFGYTCGEKAAADAGRGGAEGDETEDSISVD
jgi:hypothetical protein